MNLEKLKALMAAKKASMKTAEKTAKLSPGKNRIRLLPGWRKGEEEVWFHDFGQHFVKDAADKIQAVYLCTDATFEKPCEVCAALAQAQHAVIDDATSEVLGKARASRTVLVNALLLDSDQPNTPQILELKRSVFAQLVEIVEEWGGTAIFDLAEGKEINITRDGKGLNTKYSAQPSPKSYPIPSSVLTKLNDLDAYVNQVSEEQQRRAIAAINGVAGLLPAGHGGDRPQTSATAMLSAATPAAPATATAAAATPSTPALGDELDDLLSDLA